MTRLLARFGLAGIANTIVGYSVILAGLWAGLGDYVANAAGYSVGFVLSYVLNRRFVFRVGAPAGRGEVARYLLAIAVSYGANLGVLTAGRDLIGDDHPLVHLAAIGAYTVVFFVLSSTFVFRPKSSL